MIDDCKMKRDLGKEFHSAVSVIFPNHLIALSYVLVVRVGFNCEPFS